MLGEGVSSMVEAVWDKWTGRWFASKTIIMHEGLLKQFCVHVTIKQQGQADDGAVQGKEPGHRQGADLMEEGLHGREGHMSVDGGIHGGVNSCCEILHLADRLPSGHPSPNTSWGESTPSVWMYGQWGLRMRMA
ncbi:hypothetical protein F5148DRAFT_1152357 [Russula earlei]|uniref:Uncharacterized protein n=1 Tax=Russula earlei TaxID=71964 RepID=A0ACC0TXK3_9AGAM|nr:hypothetical protein F5148DRAFT_1152357 [Russula earlei]